MGIDLVEEPVVRVTRIARRVQIPLEGLLLRAVDRQPREMIPCRGPVLEKVKDLDVALALLGTQSADEGGSLPDADQAGDGEPEAAPAERPACHGLTHQQPWSVQRFFASRSRAAFACRVISASGAPWL